jgi:hypothetical protein
VDKPILQWAAEVPLLSGDILRRDLLWVVLASPMILLITILSFAGFSLDRKFYLDILESFPIVLGIPMVILTLLFFFVAILIYRGSYPAQFCIDASGVSMSTAWENHQLNQWVKRIGLLVGSFSVVGAGLLSQSSENTNFGWKDIHRVDFDSNRYIITVRNTWRPILRLYCNSYFFPEAVRFTQERLTANAKYRAARLSAGEGRLPRRLFSVAGLWTFSVFALAYPSLDLRLALLLLVVLLSSAAFASLLWRRIFIGLALIVWISAIFSAFQSGIKLSFNIYPAGSSMATYNLRLIEQTIMLGLAAFGAVGILAIGLRIFSGKNERIL